jgi:outer membrane protein TolC
VSSCKIRQDYERPKDLVEDKLYRTDMLPKDSVSVAQVSWKEIFTDAVLQKHISKALENNLDIRIALQNINLRKLILNNLKLLFTSLHFL